MKDTRHGEHMWHFWNGDGYFSDMHSEIIYFTVEHVDMSNEIVLRALASALQRDGVVDSLSDGFKTVESAGRVQGYAGILSEERELTVCDDNGITEYGDLVESVSEFTWVELNII